MHINIVELDAQAVRASVELVARAQPADMARPTPCADWTLHGLICHMAAEHYRFAAAAAGDSDPARRRTVRVGSDLVSAYRTSAETVLGEFSAAGVLDRQFSLPGLSVGPVVPAQQAISFHFVDYVVHSWDVARTLDVDLRFTPDLLEAALRVAVAVPDGETRLAPGSAFAPAVPWRGRSQLDQIVAILGRSPDWKRPDLPSPTALLAWPARACSKAPMGSCANTSPKAPTSVSTRRSTRLRSRTSSTTEHQPEIFRRAANVRKFVRVCDFGEDWPPLTDQNSAFISDRRRVSTSASGQIE
jgi:uncharacterized protein (TIGR03086 family)